MAVMTSEKFISIAEDIATKYKTLYVMGCFGSPLNATNKKRYTNNHEYNKRPERAKKIMNASSDTFGFDCVCLIKGILWGWNGNVNAIYGGATYCSNGVPDVGADAIMNYCTGVSNNFSNIVAGEIVHMSGHVGIYIGNGLAVECTPIWKDGVQITAVGNIGKKDGYNTRTWTNHGKLKFIDYSITPTPTPTLKYKEGDVVEINGVYVSSTSTEKLTPAIKKGTITYVVRDKVVPNPYLLDNGNIGWVNDSCIVTPEPPTPIDYEKLYKEELEKNKLLEAEISILKEKIDKAIKDLQ